MKIMAWNLQNFMADKAMAQIAGVPLIVKTLYPGGGANPMVDVFGVLEVFNRPGGPPGTPLPDRRGAAGSLVLLDELQAHDNASNWRLVPPLSLGSGYRDEGVAVYYRAAAVQFIGPNQWYPAKGVGGESTPPDPNAQPGDYPQPWNGQVPGPTFFSSRVQFFEDYDDPMTEIRFPDNPHRRPCLVRMQEGARQVDILFFHPSPPLKMDPDSPNNPAVLGCQQLARLEEVRYPTGGNVVATALIGDFNVNADTNTPQRWQRWHNAFGPVEALGYRPGLPITNPGVTRTVPTALRNRRDVTVPPNPIPVAVPDENYWSRWAIDNALVAPAAALGQAAMLDIVRGHGAWPSVMKETMAQIDATQPAAARWSRFCAWKNWYQVRRRSDHVPVIVEI